MPAIQRLKIKKQGSANSAGGVTKVINRSEYISSSVERNPVPSTSISIIEMQQSKHSLMPELASKVASFNYASNYAQYQSAHSQLRFNK